MKSMRIFVMAVEAFCAFGSVSFTCELGERFSSAFNNISDFVDQLNWYLFPHKVQKMLPTLLITTQKPVAIECFGSILCVRAALKSVR